MWNLRNKINGILGAQKRVPSCSCFLFSLSPPHLTVHLESPWHQLLHLKHELCISFSFFTPEEFPLFTFDRHAFSQKFYFIQRWACTCTHGQACAYKAGRRSASWAILLKVHHTPHQHSFHLDTGAFVINKNMFAFKNKCSRIGTFPPKYWSPIYKYEVGAWWKSPTYSAT